MTQLTRGISISSVSDHKLKVSTASISSNLTSLEESWHYQQPFTAVGSSRCQEPDTFDEEIGERLATARALKDLARQIEKDARQEIKRRDTEREVRRQASIKSIEERKARAVQHQNLQARTKPVVKSTIASPGFFQRHFT